MLLDHAHALPSIREMHGQSETGHPPTHHAAEVIHNHRSVVTFVFPPDVVGCSHMIHGTHVLYDMYIDKLVSYVMYSFSFVLKKIGRAPTV